MLAGGEVHRYAVPLAAGDYFQARFSQDALDLVASVAPPAGPALLEVDSPTGRAAPEVLAFVAPDAGIYHLEVRSLSGAAAPRDYRLAVEARRPATAEDRSRAARLRDLAAADRQLLGGTAEGLAAALAAYQRLLAADSSPLLQDRIGQAQLRLGRGREALASFDAGLALARRSGDRRVEADLLNQAGRAHRQLGGGAEAASAFAASLALWRELGDAEMEASALNNLGLLQAGSGQASEALASYRRALELFRQEGSLRFAATVLNNLGGVYDLLGQPVEAVDHYEQALALAREQGRRTLEGEALNNLAAAHGRLGRPREAVERYSEALEIFRERGDARLQAAALNNLGHLLLELGSPEPARELLLQALPLQRAAGPGRGEAAALANLGRAARDLGDFDRALELYNQALEIERRSGDPPAEAATLTSLSFLYLTRGDLARAEPAARRALDLFRGAGDRAGEALALRALGQARQRRGETAAAEAAFAEALALAEAAGDLSEQARILVERARGARERRDLAAARKDLEAALERAESLRAEVSGARLRAAHFATVREAYELYIDVLMQLSRSAPELARQAFAAAGQARARGLLDVLGQARVELRSGDPALLAEERRLRDEINARASRREPPGREIAALLAEYQLVDARLQADNPQWAGLREPEVRVEEIQRDLLGPDTILLDYSLGEPRSYLWMVTPSSFTAHELPGRGRIEPLARELHERLSHPDPAGPARRQAVAAELSRLILAPLGSLPRGGRGLRLAVVAEGALLYVPFAALPLPGRGGEVPLIAEHEVVSLPSVAVLGALRQATRGRARPPAAAAVLADPLFGPDLPALPWSRKEAEALAAEAGGREVLSALGAEATRDLALSPDLRRYRILHFATHGILDTRHPELSALVFSQRDHAGRPREGWLRLQDVYRLQIRADLVVLSGCETALGQRLRGEGLIGLTHGFLYAGASQAMASLWAVQDRATAELMRRFYRGLFRDGLRPAAALRAAQLALRQEPRWRDPHFWAAFGLQGDWSAGAARDGEGEGKRLEE